MAVETTVTLIITGTVRKSDVAPWVTLRDALREHLRLDGTKKGAITGNTAHVWYCSPESGFTTPA